MPTKGAEGSDPHMDLLWEWWVKTTEAFVDTAGSQTAMEYLISTIPTGLIQ